MQREYDMHVHTSWSDGSMPVESVVEDAAHCGLAGIAVTDHDSMEMVRRAQQAAQPLGLTVIPGVELSSIDPDTGRKVHLLVYAPVYPEALEPHCSLLARRRRQAGEEMIGLVCARYPIRKEQILAQAAQSGTIYRVHIMRALMELGWTDSIYGSLYSELFGKNGSCRRGVEYPDVYRTARAARESGGAVILAHPGVYQSFAVGRCLAQQGLIDGLELRYPRRKPEEIPLHDELVSEYRLLTTGGTDFHGWYTAHPWPIGRCTTTEEELQRLLGRCGAAKETERRVDK
ncbi:MAG: PHP domain-containing protein [Oscillospiraceae bacterium]|nr:MAG: PHP domain-containing protein [Oscillospiraceae bacterium]